MASQPPPPWERYGGAPPAVQSGPPPIPRVIEGPAREATPQLPSQIAQDRASAANAAASAARTSATTPSDVRYGEAHARREEAEANAAEASAALRERQQGTVADAQQEIQNIIEAARNAQRLSREGGVSGRDRWASNVTRAFGGTALNDLEGYLDTVKSNIAFSRLQRMRQESPTGGAVGNVSDSDLRLLASTIASLDRSQSDEVFEANLQRVIDGYQRVHDRLDQGAAQQIVGPAAAAAPAAVGGAQAPGAGPTAGPGGPLPTPGAPDSNQVQRGESMGQVGTLPIVPSSDPNGQNVVSGEGGTVLTENDRHIAGMATALANSRLPADQAIAQINNILQANGRSPLTAEQADTIRAARRNHSRHPGFSATPSGHSQGGLISQIGDSAGGAAAINYLDSASLGLPGLVSGDYREGVAAVREAHPIASTVGAIAGGLVAPGGPRPGMNIAQQSIRTGGQGLAYGFNESGGDPVNALIGGGIGAAAPGAINLAGRGLRSTRNALMPARNYADPEAQALANALQQEGVPGSRPLLDPSRRDRMAYLESSVGSGTPIRQGLEATRRGVEERAGQLRGGGVVQEGPIMGQRVQSAGSRFRDESRAPLRRDYDRAAQMAADTPIYGHQVVQELDNEIARLSRNPSTNRALLDYLHSVRSDFVTDAGDDGARLVMTGTQPAERGSALAGESVPRTAFLRPKTVGDIRDIRTNLRGDISSRNLTQTPAERIVSRALDRARNDIERDLGSAKPEAWNLYRRTDISWGLRSRELRQVVERLIGPADNPFGGGQVMNNIRSWLTNDPVRATRMMSKLNASERADLTATYAESLGREASDEPFSPALFLRRTRALPDTSRRLLFGEDGAQSIENLRRISQALKETQGRLNNSRSGVVSNWRGWLRDLTGGGPVGAVIGAVGGGSAAASGIAGAALGSASALTGMAIRRMSAKSLMNPDLSRWLAVAPRATTPSAIRNHIERLQLVATRNPVISQEITGLRQALLNAVNDNGPMAGQLAASPNEGPDQSNQRPVGQ